jgi:DNA-binding MarR family transcriptional regulator
MEEGGAGRPGRIADGIWCFSSGFNALRGALAARLGLNVTDYGALVAVVADPGMTVGRLTERTGLSSGATTAVLDRLERSRYIVRRRRADRRFILVQPTERAVAEVRAIQRCVADHLGELVGGYSESELAVLEDFVDRAGGAAGATAADLRRASSGR